MTRVFGAFFRLPFEAKPFGIFETARGIVSGLHPVLPPGSELIGINLPDYLACLQHESQFPDKIFDINTARRILCGRPRSDYRSGAEPWLGTQPIAQHFSPAELFPKIRSIELNRYGSYQAWLNSLPRDWGQAIIESLKKSYEALRQELIQESLLSTFENIEMPLLRHFQISGILGVQLDSLKLDQKLRELDKSHYSSVRNLEINHGYLLSAYEPTPNIEKILRFVPELTINDFSRKYFWDSVEAQKSISPFLESLHEQHVTRRDMNELLRIRNSIAENCKLTYDICGTVSGRILVTRPGVQYIKRSSRGIFYPKPRHKFIYADYAQFEPGILAFLSEDRSLIEAYNTGDVYTGLANVIGSGCERKVAKEIFLSFVYGMKRENIKRRISNIYNESAANGVDQFFNQFQSVERWKRELIRSCRTSLKCQGLTGYIRRFDTSDSAAELERWAPNHMIQSTASGIFKDALSAIALRLNGARMLIPMHDAILVETHQDQEDRIRQTLHSEMVQSFNKVCPGMVCKVCFEEFAH